LYEHKSEDSQANFILKSRVALTNVETQPEIAAEMAELGYDAAKITEGKSLIANVEAALNLQQDEKEKESAASAAFKEIRSKVNALFRAHRKKALFAFSMIRMLSKFGYQCQSRNRLCRFGETRLAIFMTHF